MILLASFYSIIQCFTPNTGISLAITFVGTAVMCFTIRHYTLRHKLLPLCKFADKPPPFLRSLVIVSFCLGSAAAVSDDDSAARGGAGALAAASVMGGAIATATKTVIDLITPRKTADDEEERIEEEQIEPVTEEEELAFANEINERITKQLERLEMDSDEDAGVKVRGQLLVASDVY